MESVHDFSTIDWALFTEHDRERSARMSVLHQKEPGVLRAVQKAYEASQGWIALTIIGFLAAVLAAVVGIGADWAGDLRFGHCAERGWWLTRQVCCKDAIAGKCTAFKKWHSVIMPEGGGQEQLLISFVCYVAISVGMAATASMLVVSLAPYAAGSGISEMKVVLGGFVIKKLLGTMTLLVKSVGLALSVGSGMSLGKEGPFVHVAACCANNVSRFFSKYKRNEAKKRELLSCAAAAGVAVAFGAPIGGVLFSLEEVSTYFPPKTMWRSFYCAMVAALTLQTLNPIGQSGSGKYIMFEVTYHHHWQTFELIPFALLGAIGGLIGALAIRVNAHICHFRRSSLLKRFPITEVAMVCFVTAAIDFPIIFLRDGQTSLLASLFTDCPGVGSEVPNALCADHRSHELVLLLLLSAAIKLVLLCFTFGTKVPGGIFIPCLCIGALVGRAMGIAMQMLQAWVGDVGPFAVCGSVTVCIRPAIYAIVGGAAVLGGVTRMSVSLVVIMMEVTGGMQYVIPLMVVTACSKWAGDRFSDTRSIYTEVIRSLGYPLLDHSTKLEGEEAEGATAGSVMGGYGLGGAMKPPLKTLFSEEETVESIDEILQQCTYKGFPVVTSDMHVVGYIRRTVMMHVLEEALAEDGFDKTTRVVFDHNAPPLSASGPPTISLARWMDRGPTMIMAATPFANVIEIMRESGVRYLLVVTDGELVGIIKKKDVLEHIEYHERMQRRLREEAEDS